MCCGAIIQLVCAKWAKPSASTGTGRSRLPQPRWYSGAVLRHPGGESTLGTTAKPKPALPQAIPELLRDLIKNLRRQLSPHTGRTQQEETHSAIADQAAEFARRPL